MSSDQTCFKSAMETIFELCMNRPMDHQVANKASRDQLSLVVQNILQSEEFSRKVLSRNAFLRERASQISAAMELRDDDAIASDGFPSLENPKWQLATRGQLESDAASSARNELKLTREFRRKIWDYVYVFRVLESLGMIVPGKKGLAIGVGKERLPSYLAAKGCEVTVTDQPPDEAKKWADTNQWVDGLDALHYPDLCDSDDFLSRVRFRHLDMRRLGEVAEIYDFVWSTSAVEHLGDFDAIFKSVMETGDLLAPNGVSVHTTELNLSSLEHSLKTKTLYLLRKQDILKIHHSLTERGFLVPEILFNLGDSPEDLLGNEHTDTYGIRPVRDGFTFTSFGFYFRKA